MSAFVVGVGALAAPGRGVAALRAALAHGPTTARRVNDPAGELRMRGLRPLSHASRLACVAAADALGHPDPPPGTRERRGVVLGTRWGSIEPLVEFERTARRDGAHLVSPARFPNVVVSAHAGYLGILFGLAGPNVTLCGPAAGLEAVGEAVDMLALDRADHVLAGGTDDLGASIAACLDDPGEAAAALLLAREPASDRATLARVTGVASRPAKGDRRELIAALDGADRAERLWWSGDPPPITSAVQHALAPVTGDCRAANGALAAVLAASDVAELGVPVLVTAFPADGTQAAALFWPV